MSTSVHGRTTPPSSDQPHPVTRLVQLGAATLLVAVALGTFAGILVYVTGLAVLAARAAAHSATPPQRPSARAASPALPDPGRAGVRRETRQ